MIEKRDLETIVSFPFLMIKEEPKKDMKDPPAVVFGTTRERQLYPHDTPYNRLGNHVVPCRGVPQRGPGCYDHYQVSDLHVTCHSNVFRRHSLL